MARAHKDADQVQDDLAGAADTQDTTGETGSDVDADGGTAAVADDNDNRSSETIVILPAEDEPVRRGGHILTDQGWVPEDLVPEDN